MPITAERQEGCIGRTGQAVNPVDWPDPGAERYSKIVVYNWYSRYQDGIERTQVQVEAVWN